MDSWEDYEDEAPKKLPVKASWDEEDEGDVKESWEDDFESTPKKQPAAKESWEEEFEEKPKEAPKPKPSQPVAKEASEPKKATLKDKIAQKEASAASKKKGLKKVDDEDDDVEDALSKKMREQKMVEDADIENAKDMFAGVKAKPSPSIFGSTPKTKAEFEALATSLSEKVLEYEKSKEYIGFLEAFIRKAVVNAKSDDVRKLSSVLSVIANEKQKAVSAKDKGKKQPPAVKKNLGTIKVERDEIEEYEEDYGAGADEDEYDSFM